MLLLGGHFAKGPRVTIGPEDGIVAESRHATRRKNQFTVNSTLVSVDSAVRPGERQRTDEMRPPRLCRADGGQFLLNSAHCRVKVFASARPSSGINSRCAAQGLHAQPRIIGERRLA